MVRHFARVYGRARSETGKDTYKIVYGEEGNTFHVSSRSELPSLCPFVEYELDLNEFDFRFRVVGSWYRPPKLNDVVEACSRFGASNDGALRNIRKLCRRRECLTRAWIERKCENWVLSEVLKDVGFEDAFYALLTRFPAEYLKMLAPEQREVLWKLASSEETAHLFEFWPRLEAAILSEFGFRLPFLDPEELWIAKKSDACGNRFHWTRPDRSCWRDAENVEARALLHEFEQAYYSTGVPQLRVAPDLEGAARKLSASGVLLYDEKTRWLLSAFVEETEAEFLRNLDSAELKLISCPARNEEFAEKLQDLCSSLKKPVLLAANRTWAHEATALTGLEFVALDDHEGDAAGEVVVVEMAHKARLIDLARLRPSLLILVGDLDDRATSFRRGGGRAFHDLCKALRVVERWDCPKWPLLAAHAAVLSGATYAYPKALQLRTLQECEANARKHDKMNIPVKEKWLRLCSNSYDRKVALHNYSSGPDSPLSLGKGSLVHVPATDEVDFLVHFVKEGDELHRKKDKINPAFPPGGRLRARLQSGREVDLPLQGMEPAKAPVVASSYPGPRRAHGAFYVGRQTTALEVAGSMKYCKETLELALLPGQSLRPLPRGDFCGLTSFYLKLEESGFFQSRFLRGEGQQT